MPNDAIEILDKNTQKYVISLFYLHLALMFWDYFKTTSFKIMLYFNDIHYQ